MYRVTCTVPISGSLLWTFDIALLVSFYSGLSFSFKEVDPRHDHGRTLKHSHLVHPHGQKVGLGVCAVCLLLLFFLF